MSDAHTKTTSKFIDPQLEEGTKTKVGRIKNLIHLSHKLNDLQKHKKDNQIN